MSRKRALIAFALCLAAATPAAADGENPWTLLSPWTLSRNGHFLQISGSYLSTSEFYDEVGAKQSNSLTYREFTTNLHLEYGLRNSVGLLFIVPIRDMTQELAAPPNAAEWGIGDLTMGTRWRVLTNPVVASLQGEIKLPTGYNAVVQQLPLGTGHADYTIRGLAGHSFPSFHGYADAALGYRARSGDPANQILFNADGGAWVASQLLAEAHWEYEKHKGTGDPLDRTQGGLSLRYRRWRRFDAMGGVFHTFGGQNTQAGTQFFLGLTYRGNRLSRIQGAMAANLSDTPLPEPPPKKKPGTTTTTPATPAPGAAPKTTTTPPTTTPSTPAPSVTPPAPPPATPAAPDTSKTPKS